MKQHPLYGAWIHIRPKKWLKRGGSRPTTKGVNCSFLVATFFFSNRLCLLAESRGLPLRASILVYIDRMAGTALALFGDSATECLNGVCEQYVKDYLIET